MHVNNRTPTVLVFWRGQRTVDAQSAATDGLRVKHTTICPSIMVRSLHGGLPSLCTYGVR